MVSTAADTLWVRGLQAMQTVWRTECAGVSVIQNAYPAPRLAMGRCVGPKSCPPSALIEGFSLVHWGCEKSIHAPRKYPSQMQTRFWGPRR